MMLHKEILGDLPYCQGAEARHRYCSGSEIPVGPVELVTCHLSSSLTLQDQGHPKNEKLESESHWVFWHVEISSAMPLWGSQQSEAVEKARAE